jgi:hypothetical protein
MSVSANNRVFLSEIAGRSSVKFGMNIIPLEAAANSQFFNFLQSIIVLWEIHEFLRWKRD